MRETKKYVSTNEAARLLDLVPDSIRVMARQGRLDVAIETSAGRLYLRSDVERLAAERQRRTKQVGTTPGDEAA